MASAIEKAEVIKSLEGQIDWVMGEERKLPELTVTGHRVLLSLRCIARELGLQEVVDRVTGIIDADDVSYEQRGI